MQRGKPQAKLKYSAQQGGDYLKVFAGGLFWLKLSIFVSEPANMSHFGFVALAKVFMTVSAGLLHDAQDEMCS